MLISRLLLINRELPSYNYYLDVADELMKDFSLQLRDMQCIWNMDMRIQEIEEALATAKLKYTQEADPENKTLVKRLGYLCKKSKTEKRLAQLKNQYEKKKLKKQRKVMGGCIIIPFFISSISH